MQTLEDLTARFQQSRDARDFVKAMRAMASGSMHEIVSRTKADVPALSSVTASDLRSRSRPFVQVLERRTILGQLTGTINAPPQLPLPTVTTEPVPVWVAEMEPIAAGRFDLGLELTDVHKLEVIVSVIGTSGRNRSSRPRSTANSTRSARRSRRRWSGARFASIQWPASNGSRWTTGERGS
jgi:hypothetical protein